MKSPFASYEAVALRALAAGERVLIKHFQNGKPSAYGYKAHREIVTAADRLANDAILRVLKHETPTFDVLSEEGSPRQTSPYRWIVDPLDGTTNYTAHLPLWGISIALEYRGNVVLGAISHPALQVRYLAYKNGGARQTDLQGHRIGSSLRVSKTKDMKEAFGLLCFGYEKPDKSKAMNIEPTLAYQSRSIRRLGAAVIEAAWVATGRADYSILIGVRPWDVAAGALLVREAGGRVLTSKGKEWKIDDSTIVFVAPKLEKKIVSVTKRI